MAKRKRQRSIGLPAQWSLEAQISLLSWLDHTLNHNELHFDDTIVGYLKDAYTLSQVYNKLRLIWDQFGPVKEAGSKRKPTWKDDLFTEGSSCLHGTHGISDDIKEEIKTQVQSLEDAHMARQLSTPARRLRSSSRLDEITPSTERIPETSKLKFSRSPRLQRQRVQTASVTPSAIKRESENIEHSGRGNPKQTKRQKKQIKINSIGSSPKSHSLFRRQTKIARSRSQKIINDSEDSSVTCDRDDDGPQDTLQSRLSIEKKTNHKKATRSGTSTSRDRNVERGKTNSEIRCISNASEEGAENESWIQCDGCMIWQHIRCAGNEFQGHEPPDKYYCEGCSPRDRIKLSDPSVPVVNVGAQLTVDDTSHEPEGSESHIDSSPVSTESPVHRADRRLESAKIEIKALKDQLKQKEMELRESIVSGEEQERKISSLREAQRQRDKDVGGPVEETIQRYHDLRKEMQMAINDRDALSKFARLLGNSREWFGKSDLQNGFNDIHSESKQLLCRYDSEDLGFLPSLDEFGKLRALVDICLGIEPHMQLRSSEKMKTLSKNSPQAIVRGLTTCALREWVFEENFPQFEEGPSDILAAYRKILSTQDGAIALRNLDLAAYSALVKGEQLQKTVIPEKANALAVLLSQTLAPLFTDTPRSVAESDWDGFATWRNDIDEWEERRDRLNRMFEMALKLKADSCLNIEDYEMVIYPPGTLFDGDTMTAETAEGMQDIVNNHEGHVVKLCIQAAIFAYARKPLVNNDSISEAIISSSNFLRKGVEERLATKPRVKAVVVLQEEDLSMG